MKVFVSYNAEHAGIVTDVNVIAQKLLSPTHAVSMSLYQMNYVSSCSQLAGEYLRKRKQCIPGHLSHLQ